MRRPLLALTAACFVLVAGGACVKVEDPGDGDCAFLTEIDPAPDSGRQVIVFDRSNSTRAAKSGSRVLDPVGVVKDILDDAVEQGATVSIGSFDGTAATFTWAAEDLVTRGTSGNRTNRERDALRTRACLDRHVVAAADTAPSGPGTDILGALSVAGDEAVKTTGDRRVTVVSDGLATVGCAELPTQTIGKPEVIPAIRSACSERINAMPDLTGVHLTMIGVGHSSSDGPRPGTEHMQWLRGLWTGLCADAKATSCRVSIEPVTMVPAGNGRGVVPEMADASVTYPPIEGGPDLPPVTITLSGEVLFGHNSDVITDEGRSAIAIAADSIRDRGPVTVHGYTQAQASPAENKRLATKRGEAVASVLGELGFVEVTVVGDEGRAPQCPEGDSDAANRCTRRVDIIVGGGQ